MLRLQWIQSNFWIIKGNACKMYHEGDFILECSNEEWHPNCCLFLLSIKCYFEDQFCDLSKPKKKEERNVDYQEF